MTFACVVRGWDVPRAIHSYWPKTGANSLIISGNTISLMERSVRAFWIEFNPRETRNHPGLNHCPEYAGEEHRGANNTSLIHLATTLYP